MAKSLRLSSCTNWPPKVSGVLAHYVQCQEDHTHGQQHPKEALHQWGQQETE